MPYLTSCWSGTTALSPSGRVSSSATAQSLQQIYCLHFFLYITCTGPRKHEPNHFSSLSVQFCDQYNLSVVSCLLVLHVVSCPSLSVLHVVSGSRVGGFSITTCQRFCLESCSLGK